MRFSTLMVAMALALIALPAVNEAWATSGPGCLRVVNVAEGDVLYLRKKPSSTSRALASIVPAEQGILHLDGKCRPLSVAWRSRWCPVSYFTGAPNDPVRGWVKARYVRDCDCP